MNNNPSRLAELKEIAARLDELAEAVAPELLPNGRVGGSGRYWFCGDITGAPGRSLVCYLTGARKGRWRDYHGAPDHGGDMLELVAQVRFGANKGEALRWARAWLGIDAIDPASFKTRQAEFDKRRLARREAADDEAKKRRGKAQRLFLEAGDFAGSGSEAYSVRRGIDWRLLGRYPGALRHHPACWNVESGRAWPCLLQAVVAPDGAFLTVHRTWLEQGRDGAWRKAPLDEPKMTYSPYAGGCVHLWRGATKRPWAQAEAGEWVILGEGYEDVATAVMDATEYRAGVAVSGSNLGSLMLPAAVAGAILLKQNDTEPAAIAQLARAVENFHRAGKRVRLADVPQGVKDINELAMAARAAATEEMSA